MAQEKQFELKIREYLESRGCWVLKTFSNGVQRKGIPDLLVCINGFFLAIEVKAERGIPSELQLWNVEKIRESNGVAVVLYPDQWDDFRLRVIDQLLDGHDMSAYISQRHYDRHHLGKEKK